MCSALTLVFLLGSASATETGYDGNETKLATPKPVGSVNPLIVGGGPVTPFEHNWHLYFQTGDYQCGALLINEQWALTAAHCLSDAQGKGIAVSKMKVRVHRHDLKKDNEHKCAETVKIAKKFEHPDWNDRTSANDIALLRLKQPVRCADSITMPSLDDGSYSDADTTATAAGWGLTKDQGQSSNVLKSVDLKLLTNAQCEQKYGYRGQIDDSMICAIGDLKGGEDSCQGDSGGPLFVQQGGVDIIVGIVSWGSNKGCAAKKTAGVYTRVSSYLEWIEETSGVATGKSPPAMPSPPPPPSPSPPPPPSSSPPALSPSPPSPPSPPPSPQSPPSPCVDKKKCKKSKCKKYNAAKLKKCKKTCGVCEPSPPSPPPLDDDDEEDDDDGDGDDDGDDDDDDVCSDLEDIACKWAGIKYEKCKTGTKKQKKKCKKICKKDAGKRGLKVCSKTCCELGFSF